jgi:hypothetical protein
VAQRLQAAMEGGDWATVEEELESACAEGLLEHGGKVGDGRRRWMADAFMWEGEARNALADEEERAADEAAEREFFAGGDPATLEACAAFAAAPTTTPGGRKLVGGGGGGRLWGAVVEIGGLDTAVRLLRAMDVPAFDTAVAGARREANNAMTAARDGSKVLPPNPFFVRARQARAKETDYKFWKAEQQRAWRAEWLRERNRMRQAAGREPDDSDELGESDSEIWSD